MLFSAKVSVRGILSNLFVGYMWFWGIIVQLFDTFWGRAAFQRFSVSVSFLVFQKVKNELYIYT